MDEFAMDAFANRDDPIPVLSFDPQNDLSDEGPPSDTERTRDRLMRHGKNLKENMRKVTGKGAEAGTSMQDRILEK